YYSQEGEQFGPITFAKLRSMARAGQLARDELAWQEGFTEWLPLQSIPGLQEAFASRFGSRGARSGHAGSSRVGDDAGGIWKSVLGAIRSLATPEDLDGLCRHLILVGGYALFLAMLTGPAYIIIQAVKIDSIEMAVMGGLSFLMLGVIKVVGERLSFAAHSLVQASSHRLTSPAFLDSIATVLFFLGLASATILTLWGIREEEGIDTLIYLVGA